MKMEGEGMKKYWKRFSELDKYRIHRKDQDVNDWLVRGEDNHIIGFVNDLIVDTEMRKVVYLEVSMSDDYQKAKGKAFFLLIPIENVELDKDSEEVITPLSQKIVEVYPKYDGGIITPAYLFKLQGHYEMVDQGIYDDKAYLDENDQLRKDHSYKDGHSGDEDPLAAYELAELKVKYLELKKELKQAKADREIAFLERDILAAEIRKEKIATEINKAQFNFEHK